MMNQAELIGQFVRAIEQEISTNHYPEENLIFFLVAKDYVQQAESHENVLRLMLGLYNYTCYLCSNGANKETGVFSDFRADVQRLSNMYLPPYMVFASVDGAQMVNLYRGFLLGLGDLGVRLLPHYFDQSQQNGRKRFVQPFPALQVAVPGFLESQINASLALDSGDGEKRKDPELDGDAMDDESEGVSFKRVR